MTRAWFAAASVALLAIVAFPAGANHLQSGGGKSVAFDHKAGNEWWVEVVLGGPSAAAAAKVEAMDTGGAWVVLPKKSWGAYGASFHIEPGHLVRFRAAWGDGATAESCWFTHPGGVEQCGSSPPPPPPGGFSVSFSGVKGNEWWVEAKAAGNQPIAQVDARANGGTWQPMTLRSWGAWTASFHIPPGSHVQLRARATDGAYGFAPNGWVWTAATPYPPPSSTFDARFENVKGNPNWVQANVYASANWGLMGVSYRVDGGAWRPLARQAYGDWAAGTGAAIPDGSLVQFRAESGATLLSGAYRWPAATPVPAWPVAGRSYAIYDVGGGGGSPAGDVYSEYQGTVTFRHTAAGAWQATCDLTRHHHSDYEVPTDTYATVHETKALAPPAWPANVTLGQRVEGQGVGDCAATFLVVDVVGETTYTTKQSGWGAMVPAWDGYLDDCGCHAYDADWARHHGLLLRGSFAGLGGGHHAALLDTDAPIR